jgi:hypothetical protein
MQLPKIFDKKERKEDHMMNANSKVEALVKQIKDLELTCSIWIAANEAKDQRIRELETMCNGLQQRVARLTRQAGRRQKIQAPEKVRFAR